MKLIVQQAFSWAHRGVEVEHYDAGGEIETEDQDLIEVSTAEGWARPAAAPAPAAPEPEGEVEVPAEAPAEASTASARPGRAKKQ
jgi:hypothetical protein